MTAQSPAAFFASLILYEDRHLLLVYKPHGLLVQGDQSGDASLLDYGKAYLRERYHKPGNAYLSLPHRLDRPVAGLCVLAKTSKAMRRLSTAFQQQQIRKFYLAVVEGRPGGKAAAEATSGGWRRLSHYLRKEAASNKSYIWQGRRVPDSKQYKIAELRYRCLVEDQHCSVLAVQPETGRHHQIRCQLAALGAPIRGDLKYGAGRSNNGGNISLYAFALELPMPVQPRAAGPQTPSHQQVQQRKRRTASPQFPNTYAWETSETSEFTENDGEATAEQRRILRAICLPWEWQRENSGGGQAADSIWRLCTGHSELLRELAELL